MTGAGGSVGSALSAALSAKGHRVRAVVRARSDVPVTGIARSNLLTEYVLNDLTEATPDDFASLLDGCDTIFHLAARTHMLNASPQAYERINVGVTKQLAIAAVTAGVKHFVFVSSVKAIGEQTKHTPFSPETPTKPEDEYGRTKLQAEQLLHALTKDEVLQTSIVRPPLIYGPDAPGNLARLIRIVQRGIPLPLATVSNRRSMLSRDNLVDLLVQLTERPVNRVLLPADAHFSTPQLIELIAANLHRTSRLFAVPTSLLELAARITGQYEQVRRLTHSLEITDPWLAQDFGWTPPQAPEVALAAMVQALLAPKQ